MLKNAGNWDMARPKRCERKQLHDHLYVWNCLHLLINGLQLQEEVVGTSYLAATYLKNINFKDIIYVIGSKAVCQELDEAGIKHTGVGVSHIF